MSNKSYTFKENSQMIDIQGGDKKVMKKILSVALSTAMAFSMFASVAFGAEALTPQQQFDALKAKGIVTGYPDGTSHLEKTITRAELAKVIVKTLGLKEITGKYSYKDKNYNAKNWAAPYIEAVSNAGIMQGKDVAKKIFDFNGNVTAEELATVLVRALKLEVPTTGIDNNATAWAKGYVQAAINAGFLDKNTNFKGAATRSQVAVAAYVVDQKVNITVSSAKVIDANNVEFTLSNGEVVKVKLDKALEANKETAVTFTNAGKTYTYNVTYVMTDLKVENVSAINAKEVQVKFTKPVDSESAAVPGNYTATLPTGLSLDTDSTHYVVASDKMSVIIPIIGGTLENGQSYKVDVKNVLDKDSFIKTVEYKDTYKLFIDNTAPQLLSAKVKSNNQLRLTFNEPVVSTGMVVKVDGVVVASSGAVTPSTVAGAYFVDVTAPLTGDLLNEGTHNVTVYSARDAVATSYNVADMANTTYTYAKDIVAPSVLGLTASNSNTFKIQFSEPVNGLSASNLVVKKGSYTFPSNRIANVTKDTSDTTDQTYLVTMTAADTDNPLFASGEGTVALNVTVKSYQDYVNLYGAQFDGAVTLTQDVTGPVVKSENLNFAETVNNTTPYLKVVFNEAITYGNDLTKISIKKDGVLITPVTAAVDGTKANQLNIQLPSALSNGTYTVSLASGAVTDSSNNKNLALNTSVTNNATNGSPLTLTAASGIISSQNAGIAAGDTNAITVNYGEKMTDSAINLVNYKIDGAPLPDSATIGFTSTNKDTVKISLPAGSVDINGQKQLTFATDIKSDTGKVVQTANKNTLNLLITGFVDNVKPVLNSAAFVVSSANATTSNQVRLTFNEAINSSFYGDTDDFKVTANGNKVTVGGVTDGTAGDKEIILVLANPVNVSQPLTVSVLAVGSTTGNTTMGIKDVQGNTLTDGTTVSATDKVLGTVASVGVTGSVAQTTAGVAPTSGTKEVNKLTVGGTPAAGNSTVDFSDGAVTETVTVTLDGTEANAAAIAVKAQAALAANNNISAAYDVTVASGSADVVLTAKSAATDKTVTITVTPSAGGMTGTAAEVTPGVAPSAGTPEVNTLTFNAGAATSGNVTVNFADGTITKAVTFAVAGADTAAQVAAKAKAALAADPTINAAYNVTNAAGSADVVFTATSAAADKNVSITVQ